MVSLAVMRRYARFPEARLLWTDKLMWNGKAGYAVPVRDPIPLVVPLAPNPARDVLIETLRSSGRAWQLSFESTGLAGVEAALQAGLGICAGPGSMRLHGVEPLGERSGLPALPDVDFVMIGEDADAPGPLRAFAQVLREAAIYSFQGRGGGVGASAGE